jgi:hypothetical protein
MKTLIAAAAILSLACSDAVEVADLSAPEEMLDLDACAHDHAHESAPPVSFVVEHAEPVRVEPVVSSGPSEAELRGCLAEGDAGCAGCFELATLAAIGEELAGDRGSLWADASALGLWAAGFRTCEEGEVPSVRLGVSSTMKDSWLAMASVPAVDHGGTRITWNATKADLFRRWTTYNPGLISATAAHEALHMRGQNHVESNALMAAAATHEPWKTGGIDAVLESVAALGLPTWSNRYRPAE